MPVKTSGKAAAAEKRTRTGKDTLRDQSQASEKETAERFVRDLLIRGEAAKPDQHGKLPAGATHEIVEEREGELPKIERKRFSLF